MSEKKKRTKHTGGTVVSKISSAMLTQDFKPEHWNGWESDEEKEALSKNDIVAMSSIIHRKLNDAGLSVAEMYSIKHDKDVQTGWDEKEMHDVVVYKHCHLHSVVMFATPVDLDEIAKAVGLAPQFVERPKSGRYSKDNMLAYLIHAKTPSKYAYDAKEVYTEVGRSYASIYVERKESWDKARAKAKTAKAKVDVDWLEEKILVGEVDKSQVLLTDEYFTIYAKNKRRIDDAFDTYAQKKTYRAIQALESGDFLMSIIFVEGKAGVGKSQFSEQLAHDVQKKALANFKEKWTICTVAASNPFDEYNGDEILLMDDLRGMSLTASDWLKLLDPNRASVGSARYRNKRMAPRVIIINSEKPVLEFFWYVKGGGTAGGSEALDQFIRRIMWKVQVCRYPDDSENRILKISSSAFVGKHKKPLPFLPLAMDGGNQEIEVSYDFDKEKQVEVDEGSSILSDEIMKRNHLKDSK